MNLPTKTKKRTDRKSPPPDNLINVGVSNPSGEAAPGDNEAAINKITINIQDAVALQISRRVIIRSALTSSFLWGGQSKLVTTKLIILRVLWNFRQIIHPAPTLAFPPGKQCLLTITTLLQCPLQKLILPL